MDTSRSVACDPTLTVDRDRHAANVCDKKTWMERLELVEQGLSKLRGQPWLMVGKCLVVCAWNRAIQHKRCGSRRRVDVVHAQTCRLLPDFLQTSC